MDVFAESSASLEWRGRHEVPLIPARRPDMRRRRVSWEVTLVDQDCDRNPPSWRPRLCAGRPGLRRRQTAASGAVRPGDVPRPRLRLPAVRIRAADRVEPDPELRADLPGDYLHAGRAVCGPIELHGHADPVDDAERDRADVHLHGRLAVLSVCHRVRPGVALQSEVPAPPAGALPDHHPVAAAAADRRLHLQVPFAD